PNRARYQAALRPDATRPLYTSRSRLPRVLSDELDELALAALARLHLAADLLDQHKLLVHGVADRHHHPPALDELLKERRRHRGRASADEAAVEWRSVGPGERPAHDVPA